MGFTLVILALIAAIIIRLLYRGATYRPTRLTHLGDVTVVTPARNSFKTPPRQRAIKKTLNHAVEDGHHDLVVDLSRVERGSLRDPFSPLKMFLTRELRDDSFHAVLVCPSTEVRDSDLLRPVDERVPVVGTLEEALAVLPS